MDMNGDAISLATYIVDVAVTANVLHTAILIEWMDGNIMNQALGQMNTSLLDAQGVNKSLKLMQILSSEKTTIADVVNMCKETFRTAFQKMFLTFIITQISSEKLKLTSTPAKPPVAESVKTLELLTSTLSMQVNALSRLPTDLASAMNNTTRYADQPSGPPPEFDMNKASLSFANFCENVYSRWLYEEKLNVNDDYYRHLHKVFPKKDRNDAFKIIKSGLAEVPVLTNNEILAKLVKHFKFQAADGEEFDLKEKFLTSSINPNQADQSFMQLYNQYASILSITEPGTFDDKKCTAATKTQFNRALTKCAVSPIVQSLRAIVNSPEWFNNTNSLIDGQQTLRRTMYNNQNQKTFGALEKNRTTVSKPVYQENGSPIEGVCAIKAGKKGSVPVKKISQKKGISSTVTPKRTYSFKECSNVSCQHKRNIEFARFCQGCGSEFPKVHNIETQNIEEAEVTEAEEFSDAEEEEAPCYNLNTDNSVSTGSKKTNKSSIHVKCRVFNHESTLHSKQYTMLYDDGASLNYMSWQTYADLASRYKLVLSKNTVLHKQAGDATLPVVGYTTIPKFEIIDSYGEVFTRRIVKFTVAEKLNYAFLMGTSLAADVCDSGHGCYVDPFGKNVKFNVKFNFKESVVSNINLEVKNNKKPYFRSDFSEKGKKVLMTDGEMDDHIINNIEPYQPEKLINVGSKEFPVLTSRRRSDDFINKLKGLVKKYPIPFKPGHGKFKDFTAKIEFTGKIQSGRRYIPMDPARRKILHAKVDKLLKNGVVSKTDAPANCAIFLVRKDNGVPIDQEKAWRVVNDLVQVNRFVKKSEYHIPNIQELLHTLADSKLFAKFDITDAYHNVEIDSDQDLIASVPGQPFNVQFERLPQGLHNAAQRFSQALEHIFGSKVQDLVKYLDDLLIKGDDEISLLKSLERFLQICSEFNVRLKSEKCVFGVEKVEFLSYQVHDGRIGISDDHKNAVESIDGKTLDPASLGGFLAYFDNWLIDHDLIKLLRSIFSLLIS